MNSRIPRQFESLGQYHDMWAYVLLSAPDNFKCFENGERVKVADQQSALSDAFEDLRRGFLFIEKKVKDNHLANIMREMLEMSLEAYKSGEKKRGAHILQELEGMVWKSREQPIKYAVEAERRAFGEVVHFAGVYISPFPMEKTFADLGAAQKKLFQTAETYCQAMLEARKEFKYFAWSIDKNWHVSQVSKPSRKQLLQAIEQQAQCGAIIGAVIAELGVSPLSGVIIYGLHEHGMPRVDAIAKINNWACEPFRFHFYDPTIFANSLPNNA